MHAIPAGTIDCHCHVFENQPEYPLVGDRSYTPPLCPLENQMLVTNPHACTASTERREW